MRSMTGFASKTIVFTKADNSKSTITLLLKSLNSRYFEVTCKLPHQLQLLETELIKLFKEQLHRGHIYFTLYMSNPYILKGTIEPSLPIVTQYQDAIARIKKECSVPGEITITDFLHLPNVFIEQEQSPDQEIQQFIIDAIKPLTQELIHVQQKEGNTLEKDMKKRIAFMNEEIKKIESASFSLVEEQKKKLNQTLQELELDESKFAEMQKNALYSVLDKIDIHEEIIRFKSHLEHMQEQLQADAIEKGKRLDFTLQELGREINTIAAKCSDSNISRMAINIKVDLEKVREQVQNIV
jgi:uncharacterized protein (TIGR00255 family)